MNDTTTETTKTITFKEQSLTSNIVRIVPALASIIPTEADRLRETVEEAHIEIDRKEKERVATAERRRADRLQRAKIVRERNESFRTAKDNERTQRAAATVSRMQDALSAAESAASVAESACVQDPDAKGAFDRARSARRAVDEAARDLDAAQALSAKVESEIAAAERRTIEREIEQRQARLPEIVDDKTLEAAVDVAVQALQLLQHHEDRIAKYEDEIAVLNELRARVGSPPTPEEVTFQKRAVDQSWTRIAEVALSAQAQVRRELGRPRREFVVQWWPEWRGFEGAREVLDGLEQFFVSGATGDGTPITGGSDRTQLVNEAAKVLERVKARRAARSGGSSPAESFAGVAVAGASVVALATAAATLLTGG